MAILSAIEVGFRSKKTLHGVEEGERQMVKKRGLAEEGPGRQAAPGEAGASGLRPLKPPGGRFGLRSASRILQGP